MTNITKDITHFYVFNGGGVPLYAYPSSEYDSSLIISFLTALNIFSKTALNDYLANICMDKKFMYFYMNKSIDIYYTMVTKKKQDEKKVYSNLEKIAKEFEDRFGKKIPKWQGDQRTFSDFDNYFKQGDLEVERLAFILFGQKFEKK